MKRLIAAAAILPALLATGAFAQTVTDEVTMQLWCGTAMVSCAAAASTSCECKRRSIR